MNWLFGVLGGVVGYLLGLVALKLEKRYKGKSNVIRGILLGLPFAFLTLTIVLIDNLF